MVQRISREIPINVGAAQAHQSIIPIVHIPVVSAPTIDIQNDRQGIGWRGRLDLQSQRRASRADECRVVQFVRFIIPVRGVPHADQRPVSPTVGEVLDQSLTPANRFDARFGKLIRKGLPTLAGDRQQRRLRVPAGHPERRARVIGHVRKDELRPANRSG